MNVDETLANSNPDLHAGAYVLLTVSDNGHGMTPDILEHIFEPFFTTKEVGKGTGLGLAVVHGIVKSHQGAILVKSAPGKGTSFGLYFPAARSRSPAGMEPVASVPEMHGQNQRILLVDDEEQVAMATNLLLERRGYRVSAHTLPGAALEAFKAAPDQFDLVITDYNMPVCSGIELTRQIRQVRPEIPVILASGFITEQVRLEAEAAGITQLANKPMSMDELLQIINKVLGSTSSASGN